MVRHEGQEGPRGALAHRLDREPPAWLPSRPRARAAWQRQPPAPRTAGGHLSGGGASSSSDRRTVASSIPTTSSTNATSTPGSKRRRRSLLRERRQRFLPRRSSASAWARARARGRERERVGEGESEGERERTSTSTSTKRGVGAEENGSGLPGAAPGYAREVRSRAVFRLKLRGAAIALLGLAQLARVLGVFKAEPRFARWQSAFVPHLLLPALRTPALAGRRASPGKAIPLAGRGAGDVACLSAVSGMAS